MRAAYYVTRFYDPTIGRFVQPDSIVPGGVQGYDRYAYANNSPIIYVDPTGHISQPCFAVAQSPGCGGGGEDVPADGDGGGGGGGDDTGGGSGLASTSPYASWFSGAYGPCYMCHAAVAQNQTSLTNSQLSDSYLYFYGNLKYSINQGGQIVLIAVPVVIELVSGLPPDPASDRVLSTFEGMPETVVLSEDMSAYRYWSLPGKELSNWLTADSTLSAQDARTLLALPNGNLASNVTQFIVPKGTTVLMGQVASQASTPGFGPYATGGGFQIYVPDPSVLRPVPLLPAP